MAKLVCVVCLIAVFAVTNAQSSLDLKLNAGAFEFLKDTFEEYLQLNAAIYGSLNDGTATIVYNPRTREIHEFTNVVGQSFKPMETTITSSSAGIVTVAASNVTVVSVGDWGIDVLFDNNSVGTANGQFNASTFLDLEIEFTARNSEGQFVAEMMSCTTNQRDIQVSVEGPAQLLNTITNFVDDQFSEEMKTIHSHTTTVAGAVQVWLRNICNDLRDLLSSAQTTFFGVDSVNVEIANGVFIDLSLTQEPEILDSEQAILSLNGRCFPQDNSSIVFPFDRPDLFSFSETDSSIQLSVSSYVIETLLFSFFETNQIEITVDQGLIPASFEGLILSTSLLGFFIPELRQIRPSRAIRVRLSAAQRIGLEIQPELVMLSGAFDIVLETTNPNDNTIEDAFAIRADVSATGTISISNGLAFDASLDDVDYDFEVTNTTIGAINLDGIKTFLDLVLPQAITFADDFLSQGFQIPPIFGINFINVEFELKQDGFEIKGDPAPFEF